MSYTSIWWLLTGLAVAVELATGTFYLLMFAVGLAAGAIAAHLGASFTAQLVIAAVVGSGALVAWHFLRGDKRTKEKAEFNRNVNMDIGQTVQVTEWGSDGLANVNYRGANWTAQLQKGSEEGGGTYTVEQVVGSRLILKKL